MHTAMLTADVQAHISCRVFATTYRRFDFGEDCVQVLHQIVKLLPCVHCEVLESCTAADVFLEIHDAIRPLDHPPREAPPRTRPAVGSDEAQRRWCSMLSLLT